MTQEFVRNEINLERVYIQAATLIVSSVAIP